MASKICDDLILLFVQLNNKHIDLRIHIGKL